MQSRAGQSLLRHPGAAVSDAHRAAAGTAPVPPAPAAPHAGPPPPAAGEVTQALRCPRPFSRRVAACSHRTAAALLALPQKCRPAAAAGRGSRPSAAPHLPQRPRHGRARGARRGRSGGRRAAHAPQRPGRRPGSSAPARGRSGRRLRWERAAGGGASPVMGSLRKTKNAPK